MSEELDELAAYFIRIAEEGYVRLEKGQYQAKAIVNNDRPALSLPEHFKRITSNEFLKRLNTDDLAAVAKVFKPEGLSEFKFVAEGSYTACFESAGQAFRVGRMPGRSKVGDARYNCPLIIQPNHAAKLTSKSLLSATIMFEALPFVTLINDESPAPWMFGRVLGEILDGTCFEPSSSTKDLAVLPDGTPIYVDPGAIKLEDESILPTQKDFEIIRENTERMNLPEPMSWVLPDGSFKQYQFFPRPLESDRLNLELVL